MEIPHQLMDALHTKEDRKRKEREVEQEERQREQEQEKEYAHKEKERFSQKVELCRKILSWADEFRQTKEWRKLAEKRSVYGSYDVREVTIGGWRCNPKTGKKESNWPILSFHIIESGVAHEERWSSMGYTYDRFSEPEKMAKKLHFAYLQLVWKQLESGKVFERLVRGVKDDLW